MSRQRATAKPSPTTAPISEELAALAGGDGAEQEDAPADFEGLDFAPMLIAVDERPVGGWRIHFAPRSALYANANEPALLLRELAPAWRSVRHRRSVAPAGPGLLWNRKRPIFPGTSRWPAMSRWRISRKCSISSSGHCELEIAPLIAPAPVEILPLPQLPPLPQTLQPAAEKKEAAPARSAQAVHPRRSGKSGPAGQSGRANW